MGRIQIENLIIKDKVYLIDFELSRIIDNNDPDTVKAIMCEDKIFCNDLEKKLWRESKIYGKKKS